MPASLAEVQLASIEGYAEADGYEEDVVIAYIDLAANPAAVDWVAAQWPNPDGASLAARAEPWIPLPGDDITSHAVPAVQLLVTGASSPTSQPAEALLLTVPLMRQHLLVAWAASRGRFMLCADVTGHPQLEAQYSGSRDSEGRGGMLFPVEVDPEEVEWAELAAWRRAFAATQ